MRATVPETEEFIGYIDVLQSSPRHHTDFVASSANDFVADVFL